MNADIQRAIDAAIQKGIAPLKTEMENRNGIARGVESFNQVQFPSVTTSIKNQHDMIPNQDKINKQFRSDIRDLRSDVRKLKQGGLISTILFSMRDSM
jgi:hypothetical protein